MHYPPTALQCPLLTAGSTADTQCMHYPPTALQCPLLTAGSTADTQCMHYPPTALQCPLLTLTALPLPLRVLQVRRSRGARPMWRRCLQPTARRRHAARSHATSTTLTMSSCPTPHIVHAPPAAAVLRSSRSVLTVACAHARACTVWCVAQVRARRHRAQCELARQRRGLRRG
jgi:hypothetical protein